jgi:hypothetical protein
MSCRTCKWHQQELARHVALARARADGLRGVLLEVIQDRPALGWRVVATDPEGDKAREVRAAVSLLAVVSATYSFQQERRKLREGIRAQIRALMEIGEATPERILAAIDEIEDLERRADEAPGDEEPAR